MKTNNLRILSQHEDLGNEAKTGVSLHCHTLYSKELLDFIPFYAEQIPLVKYFWQRESRRFLKKTGKVPDFTTGYWTPPLAPEDVYISEKKAINNLGLKAFISITDHDSISANLEINNQNKDDKIPVSLEWTVPFGEAFFHLGVHNLPNENASEITRTLLKYTNRKESDNPELHEIFALLNELPEILLVLNHPAWDIEMIGEEKHLRLLADFVAEHGQSLHAFEVNGFRSWSENQYVIEMAKALGFPLVSGGDRHCLHPNTIINLTDSTDFSEFVGEIRYDKYSRIIIKPEYQDSLLYRQIRSISQIVKNYPEFPSARQNWLDRVQFDSLDGQGFLPMSDHWKDGVPFWLRLTIIAIHTLKNPAFLPIFRLIDKKTEVVGEKKVFYSEFLPET